MRRGVWLWSFALVIFCAQDAWAWGPAIHVWIGDAVLSAFAAVLPVVANLLRNHADAFLYGTIAPDCFVGKGSGGHEEHCHNWSAGKALLEAAGTDAEYAFALGYMSHLAADIIGHNHFVPNCLYRSFGSKKLSHAYWELHADNLVAESYAQDAARVIGTDQPSLDGLMTKVVDKSPLPFGARKKLFSAYLKVNSATGARTLMRRIRGYSERSLSHDDLGLQMDLSLALTLSMLEDQEVPVLSKYDPVGAANITRAKQLRRASRRARTFCKSDVPFPIPAELVDLLIMLDRAPLPELLPDLPLQTLALD